MTDDDVLYEWGLSALRNPKYPADIVQLVSRDAHSAADKKRIVEELRHLYLDPEHNKAYVLLDGRGRWSRAELSRSKLGKVLMHPYWTSQGWCPDPPSLGRFASLPEAKPLQIDNFDLLAAKGLIIIVGTGDGRWRFADGCHRACSMWTKGPPAKITVVRGIHPAVEQWRHQWPGSR